MTSEDIKHQLIINYNRKKMACFYTFATHAGLVFFFVFFFKLFQNQRFQIMLWFFFYFLLKDQRVCDVSYVQSNIDR